MLILQSGVTPLMWAADGGHLEVVTFLVNHGSQLEATSTDGETALHYAAEYGEIDTTKWLIDQGCSPWVKTKEGKTPYDLVTISRYCSEEKKKEVMDFLKEVTTPLVHMHAKLKKAGNRCLWVNIGWRDSKKLYLTHPEMYKAVGEVVPERTITGLQRIRGLWRIYLDDEAERDILISKCLKLRGKSIWIYSRNPRVTVHENVTDIRIRVKDVPLSADDGQIIREMEKHGCLILSSMRERLRYNNKVTNCLTGDRIIICEGPLTEHIPRSIFIGKYRATIIYRDQPKNNPQNMKCSKCLQEGHQTRDCTNDWVCRSCGEEGHKQNACTKDAYSDAQEQSDKENTKKAMKQVMQMTRLLNLNLALTQHKYQSKPTMMKYVQAQRLPDGKVHQLLIVKVYQLLDMKMTTDSRNLLSIQ
ncbi:ASZ1 [Mytilus edulis]|uniref:ASZ1 n=1 Tax=Mytilus edulis TaxID=6550 RepID=A0A8S3Q074_MYTED|nr:ASZ1 [Mytilus edulis]